MVRLVEEVSVSGRAPKNDPAIFVLAMAIRHGDDATQAQRAAVWDALEAMSPAGWSEARLRAWVPNATVSFAYARPLVFSVQARNPRGNKIEFY